MASMLEILKEYGQAWNAHDAGKIASFYAEDGVLEDDPAGVIVKGRDKVKAYADAMFLAFPDAKIEIRNQFVSENAFAIEIVMTATNKGPLRDGTAATGKSVSLTSCGVYECEAGLVKHSRNYYDRATLTRQLGLMPQVPK
jgi:steroid delta-isomerase-like uncharacterized protein